MITDKIKKLLESPVPEDIAIGLKILIKQQKIRKMDDLRIYLKPLEFNPNEDLDIYVSRFNIFIFRDGYNVVYHCTTPEYGNGSKLLRV